MLRSPPYDFVHGVRAAPTRERMPSLDGAGFAAVGAQMRWAPRWAEAAADSAAAPVKNAGFVWLAPAKSKAFLFWR
jgi:hypothetical protein